MSPQLQRIALAMWRARERSFPGFTQRPTPDDLDMNSGAFAIVVEMARAGLEAAKYVDGADESALIEVSNAEQVEAVSLSLAFDALIDKMTGTESPIVTTYRVVGK